MMDFKDWMKELIEVAVSKGYEEFNYFSESVFKESYDDGTSPVEAFESEITYWEE